MCTDICICLYVYIYVIYVHICAYLFLHEVMYIDIICYWGAWLHHIHLTRWWKDRKAAYEHRWNQLGDQHGMGGEVLDLTPNQQPAASAWMSQAIGTVGSSMAQAMASANAQLLQGMAELNQQAVHAGHDADGQHDHAAHGLTEQQQQQPKHCPEPHTSRAPGGL